MAVRARPLSGFRLPVDRSRATEPPPEGTVADRHRACLHIGRQEPEASRSPTTLLGPDDPSSPSLFGQKLPRLATWPLHEDLPRQALSFPHEHAGIALMATPLKRITLGLFRRDPTAQRSQCQSEAAVALWGVCLHLLLYSALSGNFHLRFASHE